MTRWLTRSVVLALVILGFFFFSNNFADAPRSAVTIGGSRVEVEIANTAEERARGLMHRASLPEESGMLFLFSEASTQSFWNQNTLIPLDVVWIRNKGVLGTSQLRAISEGLQTVVSPEPVDAVLEVNRGWSERHGIKVGDALSW